VDLTSLSQLSSHCLGVYKAHVASSSLLYHSTSLLLLPKPRCNSNMASGASPPFVRNLPKLLWGVLMSSALCFLANTIKKEHQQGDESLCVDRFCPLRTSKARQSNACVFFALSLSLANTLYDDSMVPNTAHDIFMCYASSPTRDTKITTLSLLWLEVPCSKLKTTHKMSMRSCKQCRHN
jgi:hypothetical protein